VAERDVWGGDGEGGDREGLGWLRGMSGTGTVKGVTGEGLGGHAGAWEGDCEEGDGVGLGWPRRWLV